MTVVHILDQGLPLCRFTTALPGDWPGDHKWTGLDESEVATCAKCRAAAQLRVSPENYLERIDAIYAVLSVDEGGEGVVGAPLQEGTMSVPLICADEARLASILPLARMIATLSGKKMRLVKFTTREVIEEIDP